jgi:hypothetical protein
MQRQEPGTHQDGGPWHGAFNVMGGPGFISVSAVPRQITGSGPGDDVQGPVMTMTGRW